MKKVLAVLLASLFVASCGQKVEKKLIGKWNNKEEAVDIEFFEDGTALNHDDNVSVTWVVVDGSRLKLHDPIKGQVVVFEELEVSGNEMSFIQDGERMIFVRVE